LAPAKGGKPGSNPLKVWFYDNGINSHNFAENSLPKLEGIPVSIHLENNEFKDLLENFFALLPKEKAIKSF
jgi:hypothetical protein